MTIYLKNATYVDWETLEFKRTHMVVGSGEDNSLLFLEKLPPEHFLDAADAVLDCKDKLVTKSFGCAHHHLYPPMEEEMPGSEKVPKKSFYEALKNVRRRLDKAFVAEMIEACALTSALHCVKNGVTFVIDHHASPFVVENSLEIVAKVFDRIGISHLLSYEMSDRDGPEPKVKGLEETENYLRTGRQGHVGLHASFTVGDDLLKSAVNLAERYDTGIYVHTAEDILDQEYCVRDHGKRVVERYRDAGVLDFHKTLLAYCTQLDEGERRLVRESKVWVVQDIESNQNKDAVKDYRDLTQNIMLGTDGMHSDMLSTAIVPFSGAQATEGKDLKEIYNRFRKVHEYIRECGFTGDGEDSLVILDYDSPVEIKQSNFPAHFVRGFESRHVHSVISAGRLIVKNKKLLTGDEDEILRFTKKMGHRLWRKMSR